MATVVVASVRVSGLGLVLSLVIAGKEIKVGLRPGPIASPGPPSSRFIVEEVLIAAIDKELFTQIIRHILAGLNDKKAALDGDALNRLEFRTLMLKQDSTDAEAAKAEQEPH